MIKILILIGIFCTYIYHCSFYRDAVNEVSLHPLTDVYTQQLQALNLTVRSPIRVNKQLIHGRFLHITDIHPDLYYKEGSNVDQLCHKGEGTSGKYGDAILGCDSPIILMAETIKWIERNLKDKIDFIIWTGDNVRHDNDRNFPRTELNIFDMNQNVSDIMYEAFKNPDTSNPRNLLVDLIPSLGNNDVYPHNLFAPGPTLQTREMYKIWSPFIPQNQLHIFNRGAYFFREIIPNQLAILSINTLYLFQSNPLVDNCDRKKDPGYKLFEWLGVVLKEMRARNMKVWLSGHVPPNEKNYDISCLRKYIIWTYEFRDVIIGGLYGHMNIDHFIPLDAKAAYKSLKDLRKDKKGKAKGLDFESFELDDDYDDIDFEDIEIPDFEIDIESNQFDDESEDDEVTLKQQEPMKILGGTPRNKVGYLESLREEYYASIKKRLKSGVNGERYSIAHVTASVIPTFNPGLRVWEYNTTGLDTLLSTSSNYESWDSFFEGVDKYMEYLDSVDDNDNPYTAFDYFTFKKDKTIPSKKPANIPLGPAYTDQTFSPTRYTQYYADLSAINKGDKPFNYEYEYSTDDKHYKMQSLLVNDWLKLGRKLGKPVKDKQKGTKVDKKLETLWGKYLKHSFIDSDYENLGYG